MGMFRNAVPGDKYFDGTEKSERITFYDYETEYIINGNASQNINLQLTTARLMAIRFALNTLHVYSDPRKKELAAGIAAASVGWWTGGMGIPVVSNLIMCGWGLAESAQDCKARFDGEKVPLYKSEGDWKLDIGIPADKGKKAGEIFDMSYHDYLRFLLLMTSEEDKLSRIEDLIQLNMGKGKEGAAVSGYNTCIRVEAVISLNSLFLDKSFMPDGMRESASVDGNGRKKVRIVTYEGY
jgi:hypothetical protein